MKMKKIHFFNRILKCFIILGLIVLSQCLHAYKYKQHKEDRPNRIIFLLSDDHRYDYMGFMDAVEWLETPNMDRLARNGASSSA